MALSPRPMSTANADNSLTQAASPSLAEDSLALSNAVRPPARPSSNDNLVGTSGDDSFIGGSGNDSFTGGAGIDTVNYSSLLSPITLTAGGVVKKAGIGTDTMSGVEVIVGATGLKNVIDGTVADPATQTTNFRIDLSSQSLGVEGIPGLGALSFKVVNFSDVIGTNNADTIIGDRSNNFLRGAGGNDILSGGAGDDIIVGGAGADNLTLGSGRDIVRFTSITDAGDVINDFSARDDNFELSAAAFGLPAGRLQENNFAANVNGLATAARAQFVYDTDEGKLFFDADGTGSGQATLLATLVGVPALTVADFYLTA